MTLQQVKIRRTPHRQKLPDLPLYYYHTNFCFMLSFVKARYQHVFEPEHSGFLADFEKLPHNAQCLYVRLAGRKGNVFDTHKLTYPEISDMPAALRALEDNKFITSVTETIMRTVCWP